MNRLRRRLLAGLIALAGVAGARADTSWPYAPAVAARFPPPLERYDTPGLQPGRAEFTRNDELDAAIETLAMSGAAQRVDLGRTGQGTALPGLRFSRGPGRPAVLLLGQQHGNEPAGAEALLVVARQLADRDDPLAAVLEQLDVLVLPRVNPDGAALGRRRNADGLDINRDHLLLRTPEARALARLFNEVRPVLVVDVHEYAALPAGMQAFGALKRHDLLLQYATTPQLAPALEAAAEEWFRRPLVQALARAGLSSDWYHTNPGRSSGRRLTMGGLGPNLARNNAGLRNAVGLLLESRGYDLGRLHIERRVHGHVTALRSLLRSAAARAGALQRLRADSEAWVAAQACHGELVLEAGFSAGTRELLMLDPASGDDKPVRVDWGSALPWRALRTRARPCGYWLAAGEARSVERLRMLGLTVVPVSQARTLQVQRYRILARADGAAATQGDEGAQAARRLRVALTPQTLSAPPGSWYLPLDQPLAHLAVAALEPDTPDSYHAHGLLADLDGLARVMAPPR